jgi:hypothetical protein
LGRRVIIIDDDSTEKSGKLIKCPICKGTGIDYTTAVFGKPCEKCDRTGYIRV